MRAAEDIADDVCAMQARQYVLAVADAAVREGHVLDGVEGGDIGVTCERADLALHREFSDALDQLFACLPVGAEVCDRHMLGVFPPGTARHRRPLSPPTTVRHTLRHTAIPPSTP